jgi:endonuclease YncB( thermonuclease family)
MEKQVSGQCVRRWFHCAANLMMVVLTVAVAVSTPSAQAQQAGAISSRVGKVLDGDTFTLRGESRRIRVWGLDAPEWDESGGSTATSTLRNLISGNTLRCDVLDIDRYGRLVAQCFLPDGRDIAVEMIRSGAATEYCRFSRGFYGTC